jgi:hemerythrin-like domain-containing protein
MTTHSSRPPGVVDDAPVQEFSNCHVGIVAQLDKLALLPELARAAEQARQIAGSLRSFVREVVLAHHAEEEQELFPAVLASAQPGAERDELTAIIGRLAREHRQVESQFHALDAALHDLARGRDATLDAKAVAALVDAYRGHAAFEEAHFLPRARDILARNDNHMAALGMSLHARHAMPDVLRRYGTAL